MIAIVSAHGRDIGSGPYEEVRMNFKNRWLSALRLLCCWDCCKRHVDR